MKKLSRLAMAGGFVALLILVLANRGSKLDAQTGKANDALPRVASPTTLQGIWVAETQTPLERLARYGTREIYTDEEYREAFNQYRQRLAGPNYDSHIAARGTEQDVNAAYNAAFLPDPLPPSRRTSMIVDPPDGRMPARTAQALQQAAEIREFQLALLQATDVCKQKLKGCEGGSYGPISPRFHDVPPSYIYRGWGGGGSINRADGPEDRDLAERCLIGGLGDTIFDPRTRMEIVQAPDSVSIAHEMFGGQGFARVIPISTQPHLRSDVRLWWGDSRGRWEGNSLVVDVTNFSPKSDFLGAHENLHLIQRFTRSGPTSLEVVTTVEDTTTWTKAWTIKQELKKQSDEKNDFYTEPRCHEGNQGLTGTLLGARADEKLFEEGLRPDPAMKCRAGCGTGLEELR